MFEDKPRSKYELTLITKLAQQTQRYEQMAQYANKLLSSNEQLTNSQRNLCASAYKNLVNNRRAQLKVLNAIQKKLTSKQSKQMMTALSNYKKIIEDELVRTCLQIIKIVEQQIIPQKVQIKISQAKVFYLKMRGDFYRYLCEVQDHDGAYFASATACYEEAQQLARSNLPPTNQVRLSLHLNMSVFLYERCQQTQKALQLANSAFNDAVAHVNQTNQQSFKNCTMILQLIRDNINLWSEENEN